MNPDCIKSKTFDFTTAEALEALECTTVEELHVLLGLLTEQKAVHYWGWFENTDSYLVHFGPYVPEPGWQG